MRNASCPYGELIRTVGPALEMPAAMRSCWDSGYSRSLSMPATTVRAVTRDNAASIPPLARPTGSNDQPAVSGVCGGGAGVVRNGRYQGIATPPLGRMICPVTNFAAGAAR
jgi:hypothetical protein